MSIDVNLTKLSAHVEGAINAEILHLVNDTDLINYVAKLTDSEFMTALLMLLDDVNNCRDIKRRTAAYCIYESMKQIRQLLKGATL